MPEKRKKMADSELVLLSKEGDPKAFTQLHDKYKNHIYNFIHRALGQRHLAEELTQDTFLAAFKNLLTLKDETRFKSWLFSIAANLIKKTFRRKASGPTFIQESLTESEEGSDDQGLLSYIPDESQRPDQLSHRAELHHKIQECLETLSTRDRSIILLCDVEGLTYKEAAESLKLSEKFIGSYLQRARRRFRKLINLDDFDIKFFFLGHIFCKTWAKTLYYVYYQNKIVAYVDHELTPEWQSRMDRFVKNSAQCHDAILQEEKTKIVLHLLPRLTVSAVYEQRYQQRFEALMHAMQTQAVGVEPLSQKFSWSWQQLRDLLDDLQIRLWCPLPAKLGLGILSLCILTVTVTKILMVASPMPSYSQQGSIQQYNTQTKQWDPITDHRSFQKGSLIQVAKRSSADFSVGELYGLRLMENASIEIHDIIRQGKEPRLHISLLKGQLFAKAGKEFQSKTFQITVHDVEITVKGTAFALDKSQNDILIELVEGQLEIRRDHQVWILQAREFLRIPENTPVQKGSLDIHRLNALIEELNPIPPVSHTPRFQIRDLKAELTLIKDASRVRHTLVPLFLKLTGQDRATVEASIQAIVNIHRTPQTQVSWKPLTEYLIENYPTLEATPQILLFITSFLIEQEDYTASLALLEKIVTLNHANWSSFAQCQIGFLYEEKLQDTSKAQEAYQKVLDLYPNSIDAPEAGLRLRSLTSKP